MAEQVNKSPAFQFYPKDFLTDIHVATMTNEQIGVYVMLLCHDWLEDGLTEDQITNVCSKLKVSCPLVRDRFIQHPTKSGYFTNPRLIQERIKQARWSKKCSEAGKKSAESRATTRQTIIESVASEIIELANGSTKAQPKLNSSSSSSSSSSKDIYNHPQKVTKLRSKFSLETWKPPEGKTKYADYVYLTEAEYAKAEKFYQNLGLGSDGVKRALQHLDAWFVSNPKKRAERTDDYRALIGWPAQRVMEEMAALNRLTRSEQTLKGDFRR